MGGGRGEYEKRKRRSTGPVAFDVESIALANFAVQCALIILVLAAVFLAKRRGSLRNHCTLMRVAVPVQIAAVLGVMLPSMMGYIENERPGPVFTAEMLLHHGLGLLVIMLWVYINLVSLGVIGTRRGFKMAMRSAFALWLLTFGIGLHLYFSIWA